jgi:RHS repeat-associated protein
MKRLLQRIRQIVASPLGAACLVILLPAIPARAQNYCNNPVPPCNPNDPASSCYKPPDPPPKCEPKVCDKCTKSPCYVGSGVYAFDEKDLEIATTGFPIAVTRLYQSSHAIDGESGFGWTSSLSSRLYYAVFLKSAPGTYQREADIRLPNGNVYRFVENANGTYTPPEGRFDTLVRNADSTWDLWLQRTRSHYHFSATGNLLEIVDDFGNTQTWTYASDRLQHVEDTSGSGRSIDVTYGGDGRISDVTDLTGRTVHYAYTAGGVLASVTNPAGQVTSYSYTNGKYVPLLTAVTDNWGRNLTTVVYDAQDRTRSYTDRGETFSYTYNYNGVGTTTAKSDSAGNAWQYTFTPGGLVADSRPPGGGPTLVHDDYYSSGLLQQRTDGAGVKFYLTYDAKGHPLTLTQDYQGPTAVQWRYVYDVNFPDAIVSATAYDPATNQIHPHWQSQKQDYYPPGSVAPGALYRQYLVDSDGVTAHLERTFTYDSHGRTLTETDGGGNTKTYTYDQAGNRLSIERAPNNTAGTHPTISSTYDALGRVASTTDPDGHTTTYSWDVLDRIQTVTLPKPSASSTLTFTRTYVYDEYDAALQLLFIRIVDQNGRTTRVGYSPFGDAVRLVDSAGNVVRNTYNHGLLASQTDANGNVTSYAYDALRRLSTVTYPDGTFERSTYGPDGTVASRRDRMNRTINYTYDRHKRVIAKIYPNAGSITSTYQGQKLTQVVDTFASPAETHTYGWDASFRLASDSQGSRGTLTATRTADGRVSTISIAGGTTRTYSYYPDGSLHTIAWSAVPGAFTYEYTPSGRTSSIAFPNGQTRTYTYDDQGRPTNIVSQHPVTGTLAAFAYGYDLDAFTGAATQFGMRTTIAATIPAQSISNAVTKLGYDDRYFLSRADYPATAPYNGRSDSWTYDAAGNRATATSGGATRNYVYEKWNGNPLNGTRLQSDGTNSYTYDGNGNVTARGGDRGNFTFSNDYENRRRSVAGDTTAGYLYDWGGRRALKTVNGTATTYLYDGFHAIAENGPSPAEYLFGPGLDSPLAMLRNGVVHYLDTDVLETVAAVNDGAGATENSFVPDAWGSAIAGSSTVANPVGFTAREDAEAGYLFYRARYYEPATGRFAAEDPLASGESLHGLTTNLRPGVNLERIQLSLYVNPYLYVINDPALLRDPEGLNYQMPGCDRIPWCFEVNYVLDCCYEHDQCYAASDCNGWSWTYGWFYWPGACGRCDRQAIGCILRQHTPPKAPDWWYHRARQIDPPKLPPNPVCPTFG